MRPSLAFALLFVAAPALGHPPGMERDTQQQIQMLQATIASMQSQFDADRGMQMSAGGRNMANLLRQAQLQVNDLSRQMRGGRWEERERVREMPPPPPPPPPMPRPMDEGSFRALIGAINAEGFSEGKLRVIGAAAQSQFFLVGQLKRIVEQLSFSADKVGAVRVCAPRLLDRQNAFKLYEAFTFSSDKEQVRQILERN